MRQPFILIAAALAVVPVWAQPRVLTLTLNEAIATARRNSVDAAAALDELRQDYGIQVYPIVTVREVIAFLHNNPVDGKVYIDDDMKAKMEAYLEEYGAKG